MAQQFPVHEGYTTFGLHLMLDAYGANPKHLADMSRVYHFLNDLPDLIEMKKLAPPQIIDADATEAGKDPGGITGAIIIAESHISIHTFAKRGFFTMDLYSCNNFEDQIDKVMKFTQKTFPFKKHELQTITRGLEYPTSN